MKNILNDRTLLRFTGADSKTFFHGILTQDFKTVENHSANFSLMLTPQGKYLFDMIVYYDQDDIIYMDMASVFVESFMKKFKIHKLRAEVSCENLNDEFYIAVSEVKDHEAFISFMDPRHADLGHRSFILKQNNRHIIDYTDSYHNFRYGLGIMDGAYDMKSQSTIVLEAGFEELNGVNWKKGCYMGQELMSRIARRKLMKKRLLIVDNPDGDNLFVSYTGFDDPLESLPLVYKDDSKAGRIYRSRFSNKYLIASLYVDKLTQDTYIKVDNDQRIQIKTPTPAWVDVSLFVSD